MVLFVCLYRNLCWLGGSPFSFGRPRKRFHSFRTKGQQPHTRFIFFLFPTRNDGPDNDATNVTREKDTKDFLPNGDIPFDRQTCTIPLYYYVCACSRLTQPCGTLRPFVRFHIRHPYHDLASPNPAREATHLSQTAQFLVRNAKTQSILD